MGTSFSSLRFVSTAWLGENLNNPAVRVVDGSWHLPPTGRNAAAEYAAAHIPGAVFINIDVLADTSSGLPHMLPGEAQFAGAIGALGISNDNIIVVYDQTGLFSAPRVAWMLKIYGAADVRLLEGGLPRWQREMRPVTTELSSPAPAIFDARLDRSVVADATRVAAALADPAQQVVDARPAARFAGDAPEPRPGVRAGHMPGSLNLPFDALIADGELKSADEIRTAMAAAGVDGSMPVITSCGSGVSAAIIALALEKAGSDVSAIYDGSWAEWGSRADLPLGTGPAKAR